MNKITDNMERAGWFTTRETFDLKNNGVVDKEERLAFDILDRHRDGVLTHRDVGQRPRGKDGELYDLTLMRLAETARLLTDQVVEASRGGSFLQKLGQLKDRARARDAAVVVQALAAPYSNDNEALRLAQMIAAAQVFRLDQ